jgi:hypothetical protein
VADALHTPGVTSAAEARLDDAGLIAVQGPTALDARTGVLVGPGTTALVTGTADTSPMAYLVAPHHWVTNRGVNTDGVYRGALEAATRVTTTAAPGSGSRIDVIYEKQGDANSTITPDASTAPVYGCAQGNPTTGTPVKPSIPVGAIELATATVSAGATATNGAGVVITNTARQTVARGARIPVRNQAERDALTAFPGLEVYRLDTGQVQLCTATGPTTWATTYDPAALNPLAFPYAFLRQTTAMTGQAAGWQDILLQAEDFDSHGAHDPVTNPARWTCPAGQGGVYAVHGTVQFSSIIVGLTLNATIAKNGTRLPGGSGSNLEVGSAGDHGMSTGRKLVTLAPTDYVTVQGFCSGAGWGTKVNTTTDPQMQSTLAIERIR